MLRTVLDRLAVRVLKNFGDYFNLRACLASWLFVLEAAFGLKLVGLGVFALRARLANLNYLGL